MLTIWVEIETFSRSCGLVGTMSVGTGSCSSFCPSAGRLFFLSFEVGGWRRDCEKVGTFKPSTISIERATAKNTYRRLIFIVFTPGCDALALTGVYHLRNRSDNANGRWLPLRLRCRSCRCYRPNRPHLRRETARRRAARRTRGGDRRE